MRSRLPFTVNRFTPFRFFVLTSFLLNCLYALFSFSLTDPNLVLLQWTPYWNFQQWMWQTFFKNPVLLTQTFLILGTLLFGSYFGMLWQIGEQLQNLKANKITANARRFFCKVLVIFGVLSLPLLCSYNALSHDVFNYLFNAKMLLVYHQNPHIHVALEFAADPLTRFMHNTHTPAPYGYGWTALSVIPYLAGGGKFLSSWWMFRLSSVVMLLATASGLWFCLQQVWTGWSDKQKRTSLFGFAAVFLNPLLLIELISNSHNDAWMLAPAVWAVGLVILAAKKINKKTSVSQSMTLIIGAVILLAISISTKLVTIVLLPILGGVFLLQTPIASRFKKFEWQWWLGVACAALLFLPLLTARSQQFQPWYLSWVLIWLPLIPFRRIQWLIIALSVSSFFRYIPWLLAGGFSDQIVNEQKMITWIGWLAVLLVFAIVEYALTARSAIIKK